MSYKRNSNCKCSVCSKEIYRRPYKLASGPVFCSCKCSNIRNKKDDAICICGNIVPRRRHSKTCSRECYIASRQNLSFKNRTSRNLTPKYTSKNFKKYLLNKRGNKCNRCECDIVEILQIHHIIERCNGGTHDELNLEILCPNCHAYHHYVTNTKE